jgi:hypothetical protein
LRHLEIFRAFSLLLELLPRETFICDEQTTISKPGEGMLRARAGFEVETGKVLNAGKLG